MQEVAGQINDFSFEMTETIEESVKMTILDTLNAMIMGANEEEIQQLIQTISNFDSGHYPILGDNRLFSLTDAGFLMGTSSVAVELDEGNQWSKGHPAVHVLPILLLHALNNEMYSGEQFIYDFVKSYEVCTYFGKITKLKPDLHAHGTWGVMGSAASLAIANKADKESLAKALNVAATFATPTRWTAVLEGAGVRNVYVGESIVGGLRAWQLACSNIEAPKQNADFIFSSILGSSFQMDTQFKQPFLAVENNYFKQHAFCRYVHVPLEAFQQLVNEYLITPEDIHEVKVMTYQRAATLNKKTTNNSLSSKFSIPFALASWMYEKRSDHRMFKEKYYLDDKIRNLSKKVEVIHDPKLDENYPNIMPAMVKITFTNGKTVEKRLDFALGGPQKKNNFNEIKEKFLKNTEGLLTMKAQKEVLTFVEHLEEKKSVKEIFSIINSGLERGSYS